MKLRNKSPLTIAILGAAALVAMATSHAQRPSFGGLFQQVQDLENGNRNFGQVSFGDECRFRVDPTGEILGLIEEDPTGFRLLGDQVNQVGCRLLFGPTDDCTIMIDPLGPGGLLLRDPSCIRLMPPQPLEVGLPLGLPPSLYFGPTDDCSIGIDPEIGGMVFRDRGCFIFRNPDPLGIPEVNIPAGLLRFGDECTIGVDPQFTGLVESDPGGFRLLGDQVNQIGCQLLFGPTDDCTIMIDPLGPGGLLLRDPSCIRLLAPPSLPTGPPPFLYFGPTDDCSIGIDPEIGGMVFRDRGCFIFRNPDPLGFPEVNIPAGLLRFGDECTIGVNPQFTGLVESDPGGLRLLGQNGVGCILTFGPTDECRILVDPAREDNGLILSDVKPILFENPQQAGAAQVQIDGVLTAAQFAVSSSRDLKENIRTIEEPIEKVKKLRGVYFDWKESSSGNGAEVGFIADEVAGVVGEAVVYNDEDDESKATGVKYANLVALTVEGIKAQQEQIDAQQELIDELRKEVAALREGR